MAALTKRWLVAQPISLEANQALMGYSPILRQILYNRGYTTAEQAQSYLEARTLFSTDPFGMLGMLAAVERLERAIQNAERIAVYGDYDADGVTATALLVQVLTDLGATVDGYIPNRFDEGYGLNKDALSTLQSQGVRLVITVDCGIRSPEEALHALQIGLDMIITDHHHPADEIPQALAVINPKQPGDTYPDKDLAGVGLAYKLGSALISYLRSQGYHPAERANADHYLDLVAIGTVADLAPLTNENRALVRAGLQCIRQRPSQGIFSLVRIAELKPEQITAGDIGFILGPRLNAAGRLESALDAFRLLVTRDPVEAVALAQKLDSQNRERQQITREIQAEAEKIALSDDPEALVLFAADPSFNPGVVGLAASRLLEVYYRPALVAYRGDEFTRGSCRSITEFHITKALDQCADLLEHHGGHAAAAGFTVRNDRLPELIRRLKVIASQELSGKDLRPVLRADAVVSLKQLRVDVLKDLEKLQPTGFGNGQALFVSRNLFVKNSRPVGKESTHLKLALYDSERLFIDAIAFKQGHRFEEDCLKPGARIDLLYAFELNEYNGRQSLQLNVRDFKPAGTPD